MSNRTDREAIHARRHFFWTAMMPGEKAYLPTPYESDLWDRWRRIRLIKIGHPACNVNPNSYHWKSKRGKR